MPLQQGLTIQETIKKMFFFLIIRVLSFLHILLFELIHSIAVIQANAKSPRF